MSHNNPTKKINLSFFGGVEEITGCRKMQVTVNNDIRKITQFIKYMYDEVLKDNPKREELLIDDKSVRPGILVLHNNRDINLFTVRSFLLLILLQSKRFYFSKQRKMMLMVKVIMRINFVFMKLLGLAKQPCLQNLLNPNRKKKS